MSRSPACPTNQQPGQPVDTLTLKALLARPLTELSTSEYLFCGAPNCPTVYYSADGSRCFTEADLRERVFQKHLTESQTWVCYCFRFTIGDIIHQPQTTREQIQAGIRAGRCACDTRDAGNPQGDCCLGNVNTLIKRSESGNESFQS